MDRPGPALQLLYNYVHNTWNYSQPFVLSQVPAPPNPNGNGQSSIETSLSALFLLVTLLLLR